VEYPALGAHGIQMSGHSQTKLSDCLAPRGNTVLVACPQRLAVGQAQTHGLAVCVTQVRVALFGHGNTLPLSAGTVALGVRTHTANMPGFERCAMRVLPMYASASTHYS
jgi:hypothetical protein